MLLLDTIKGRRRELCPFCFDDFRLRDTPFRCASPMTRCAPEVDSVLQRHWQDSRPAGVVLPAVGRNFVRTHRCPKCSQESRKRLCPHCHSELPYTIGDLRTCVFAVIGAKEAGKSHYIAVLVDQLRQRVGPSLNMTLGAMSDDTITRYRNDYYDPLYKNHRVLNVTKSGLVGGAVRRPLVYSLTLGGRNLLGRSKIRDVVVLVFFDTAGEDLNSEDTMSVVNKYIYRSNGIILLVDPLQLPTVRNRLGSGTALPFMNTETADIMTRTTQLVHKGLNLNAKTQIPIPLAVAFSKFDAVGPIVGDQLQLASSARHRGGFDLTDFNAINGEMMSLLADWGDAGLVQQVSHEYAKFGFFGISALGCNPHGREQVARIVPRRVEDPFLWLLAQNKIIPSVRAG